MLLIQRQSFSSGVERDEVSISEHTDCYSLEFDKKCSLSDEPGLGFGGRAHLACSSFGSDPSTKTAIKSLPPHKNHDGCC